MASIIRKDNFAAPTVHQITAANLPKVVKAGKPIIRIETPKGGAPFFTNYGTEQGLALSGVFCGLTDRAGNLWFGTRGGGVSKYDGKNFTNYTVAQGLGNNAVLCIIQDKAGNLWFGTDAGMSKYDGSRFTNYTMAQGLVSNNVQSIIQDTAGNLWFGSYGGVSKYDGKRFTNYNAAQGLASNEVSCIIQDTLGNLWFGTQGKGVSKLNGSSFTNYTTTQGLASNNVGTIMQDKKGNIWFGTDGQGVSKYDGSSFTNYTTTQGLANNSIRGIVQDRKGNIWFSTMGGGVSKYDGSSFTNYTTAQGLASNLIFSGTQDRDGNIWFGTTGSGVSKYDDNGFTNYTSGLGVSGNDNYVQSIIKDNAGNLWFGIEGGGISKYDGGSFANYTTGQGLTTNYVQYMLQDRKGNIWFSAIGKGVGKYTRGSFINYTTAQGLAGTNVWCIMQDRKENIWFSTIEGGVSKYDGNSFTNYTTAQGLPSNSVFRSIQDRNGNIWFGTSAGVSKYDGKSFTNYTTSQGLAGNSIFSILQDRKGNIWFGTDGRGVSKYDGTSFTNYTTSQGLSDNTVYVIIEDSIRNIIWFGTNQGLSALKQDSSSSDHNNEGSMFEIFNNSTGYPIKDLNWNSLCLDSKGLLWAGCGDNKVLKFDYAAINKNVEPLSLQIQTIKVNNENICWNNLIRKSQHNKVSDSLTMLNEMVTTFGKVLTPAILDSMREKYGDIRFDSITKFYPVPVNLVLPYENNNLIFDFAAIEPAIPKQVKYQYKLEGYDKDWSPLTNNTSAVYGRIREGNYTFKLKALSPFGVWSETKYTFKVLPPWQRTWWAYTIFVFLLIYIIYLIYRIRLKQILAKLKFEKQISEVEMKALRSQMNPHFIFNSLNSIHRFIQLNNTDDASEYLIKFSKLMRLILENSLHSQVLIEKDLQALGLYMELESARMDHKFTYEIKIGENLDPEGTMIPPLILQPFVENAIWHGMMNKAGIGKITLRINKENDMISCVVEDDGIGRQKAMQLKSLLPEEKHESVGMKLTQDRINIINSVKKSKAYIAFSDLYDEAKNPVGTRVEVKLPLELRF